MQPEKHAPNVPAPDTFFGAPDSAGDKMSRNTFDPRKAADEALDVILGEYREFDPENPPERAPSYGLEVYLESVRAKWLAAGDVEIACLLEEAAEAGGHFAVESGDAWKTPWQRRLTELVRVLRERRQGIGPAKPEREPNAPGTESADAAPKGSGGKATINARMLEKIQAEPLVRGWNSRQWTEYLKCAKSSVAMTRTWEDLSLQRSLERAKRAEDRRGRNVPGRKDRDA